MENDDWPLRADINHTWATWGTLGTMMMLWLAAVMNNSTSFIKTVELK